MGELTVLGIETSCDETAAAVVRVAGDRVQVLSSVVASQIAEHAPFGGVVPEIAARAHVEHVDGVIAAAMAEAGVDFDGLSGVAATAGPGLVGGVMVGLSAGKAIALARGLPLARAAASSSGQRGRATASNPSFRPAARRSAPARAIMAALSVQ